jgi:dTDP-4-dehydrorhamnose reductase
MSKKVLITGSNGLLGQKLSALLVHHAQLELVATSRGENKLARILPELRFISLDITDASQVAQVIAAERPTHIIHTAAMTNVDECEENQAGCWQLNVTAVQHLVKACEQYQVHLIHLSTDFIFDGQQGKASWLPKHASRQAPVSGLSCARCWFTGSCMIMAVPIWCSG